MLKLRRFLKPFIVALILAIALLAIQAVSELNLPNLMSKIVNVGIQQGGIEEIAPAAMPVEAYEFIEIFLDEDQKSIISSSYTLADGLDRDEQNKPYFESYPAATGAKLYIKNTDLSAAQQSELDETFSTVTWTMINLLTQLNNSSQALGGTAADSATSATGATGAANTGTADTSVAGAANTSTAGAAGTSATTNATSIQSIDFKTLYELKPVLEALPSEHYDEARAQAQAIDPSLREQSATMLSAALYSDLGVDMAKTELDYILYIGLMMLVITVLSGAATILVGYLSARIGAGVARNLRREIFKKVVSFSHTEFDRFSTASLITRSTNDVMVVQTLLTSGIRMICYAPIMGLGGVFMALNTSVSMGWIIGVAVVVLIGIMLVMMVVVMPKFEMIQKLIDRLNLIARQSLNGLMVVRAFSRMNFETTRFDDANKELTATNLFVNRAMTFMMPVMILFMNGMSILILWVGAHQVSQSQMQVGDMMAYTQYIMQIIMSFMFISMLFVFIPRAQVSAKRINEILETKPVITNPLNPTHIDDKMRGYVEFKNVCFRFEGAQKDALSNISFRSVPGQTTAFIGSTGSGKSTIMNLIPRFYDATSGEVLVGGVNVRDLNQSELRAQIGYVPQTSVLMAGTIATNIAYGTNGMQEDDMRKVANVAQAIEFIDSSEERFETPISQGGTSVSGGQRQRLAIARALAVDAGIYLFDDSFAALDFKTDAALRRALAKHTKNATLLIVAQRISTIMDADQIFVIDGGKIVGSGKHLELLKTCKEYREIATSQLSVEELKGASIDE